MTTADIIALLEERKRLAALLREHRIARAYAEHGTIASVERAIATLVQDGINLSARQKIGASSMVAVVITLKEALKDDVTFAQPASVWNRAGFSGVATSDWPQVLKQRILSLTASLDYVIERDGLAA